MTKGRRVPLQPAEKAAITKRLKLWHATHERLFQSIALGQQAAAHPLLPPMVELALIIAPLVAALPEVVGGREPLKAQAIALMNSIEADIGRPMMEPEMNAFRHVVTGAILTREVGADASYLLGIVNEIEKDLTAGQTFRRQFGDRNADLYNNHAGILLAEEHPQLRNEELAQLAWQAVAMAEALPEQRFRAGETGPAEPLMPGDVVVWRRGKHIKDQTYPQGHWADAAQQAATLPHHLSAGYDDVRDQVNGLLQAPQAIDVFSMLFAATAAALVAVQVSHRQFHRLKRQLMSGHDRELPGRSAAEQQTINRITELG